MTLRDERYRALAQMRGRLYRLALTPGPVKKRELRREVAALLRHYPSQYELERIARDSPEWLKVSR